jgi:hypothetical protein
VGQGINTKINNFRSRGNTLKCGKITSPPGYRMEDKLFKSNF